MVVERPIEDRLTAVFTRPYLPQERLDEDAAEALRNQLEELEGVDWADWSWDWFCRALTRQPKYCKKCETTEGRRLACFRVIPVENTVVEYFCRFCAEEIVSEGKWSPA